MRRAECAALVPLCVIALSIPLGGCVGPSVASARPIVSTGQTTSVDLVELIASQLPAEAAASARNCDGGKISGANGAGLGPFWRRPRFAAQSAPLECALAQFNNAPFADEYTPAPGAPAAAPMDPVAERLAHLPGHSREAARNRILERLVAASGVSCDQYVDNLQVILSEEDFALGAVTTALAGAGGLVGAEGLAKALSGTAAIVSGVDARFKDSFFANFATHVLAPAMRARRTELLRELRARRADTLTQYSLEQGLADVLAYHGACNMTVAVEVASAAVKDSELLQAAQASAKMLGTLEWRVADLLARSTRTSAAGTGKTRAANAGTIDAVRGQALLLQDQLREFRSLPPNLAPGTAEILDLAGKVEGLSSQLQAAGDDTDAATRD